MLPYAAVLALALLGTPIALGGQQATDTGSIEGTAARRIVDLWEPSAQGLFNGVSSPDGRSLLFTYWPTGADNGTLAVQDLETGDVRQLTSRAELDQFDRPLGVSPDGRWIAFVTYLSEPDHDYSLRAIGSDGAGERTLLSMVEGADSSSVRSGDAVRWAELLDWSQDGSSLLLSVENLDRTFHLELLSRADGSRRTLQSLGSTRPEGGALSPDGRFVVYAHARRGDAGRRDISLLHVDGTAGVRLTDGLDVNSVVGLSADGSGLYYSLVSLVGGERTSSLWRLPMRDGRRDGTPALVKDDLPDTPTFQMGRDRIFYTIGKPNGNRAAVTMAVDLESGRVLGPPSQVKSFLGPPWNNVPFPGVRWTPDGQELWGFRSQRSSANYPGTEIVLTSPETARERIIPLDFDAQPRTFAQWDRSTIVVGGAVAGRDTLMAVNLASGQTTPFPDDADLLAGRVVRFSPDQKTKYVTRGFDGAIDLVAVDIASGRERILYSGAIAGLGRACVLSPDGSMIALMDITDPTYAAGARGVFRTELRVLSSDGGPSRLLHTSDRGMGGESLNWSPDGRRLVFYTGAGGLNSEVWTAAVDGSGIRLLFAGPPIPAHMLQLSPDGRRIAFAMRDLPEPPLWEHWVLENLPDVQSTPRGSAPR